MYRNMCVHIRRDNIYVQTQKILPRRKLFVLLFRRLTKSWM